MVTAVTVTTKQKKRIWQQKDIKRIVDDEQVEQLTTQLCRHWEVATERLEGLAKELEDGMDTCAEAEIYAALMRMQSAVMALMELSKPTVSLPHPWNSH